MAREFGIIDLFAGPGGLGEGFSAAGGESATRMSIRLSVEKESTEVATLRLRAFLRSFHGEFPPEYYQWLNRESPEPDWAELYPRQWTRALEEARGLTLGAPEVFNEVALVLDAANKELHGDTILIGGPPCQAYSLAGRSRNRGKANYVAEEDHRHFLYKEYVAILNRLEPAAFVMENVKGILSSKVDGGEIFQRVLQDLREAGTGYRLFPLSAPVSDGEPEARDFIVRAECHGVPQARHRVFILGLREDLPSPTPGTVLLPERGSEDRVGVLDAIGDLPNLRSGLSRGDSAESWRATVLTQADRLLKAREVPEDIRAVVGGLMLGKMPKNLQRRHEIATGTPRSMPKDLEAWLVDPGLATVLHHETRGHIPDDLGRYLFAAAYGSARKASPKLRDFPSFLQPEHRNRESGAFADRFRVQLAGAPSSTVTSHISKDGHYFIHPDPKQVRALTVREAARLQTFPDNYLFQGTRTAQYHQVGNAVPPYLALQIGRVVRRLLSGQ